MVAMAGIGIQIDTVKDMLKPTTPKLILDILPSCIYFMIIIITILFAGIRSSHALQAKFIVGMMFQIAFEGYIAIIMGRPDSDTKNIWLALFFMIFGIIYCSSTLPAAILIVHNFSTNEKGTSWFAAAFYLSKLLCKFLFPWLVLSEVLSKAWAYYVLFEAIPSLLWIYLLYVVLVSEIDIRPLMRELGQQDNKLTYNTQQVDI
ncbi:hypothetical protein PMAYCL1PPCAC_28100 [Pristionchus mayeri]|uniref:Uncharacterized protein n=1 Tax=Pristionchus mayeri TaxID=1317129 RepID=A0AAN5D8B0_9BILA|nr:hypothetical protein PMAYCL1PPCAC_28100 [Pristionchus mayeri]